MKVKKKHLMVSKIGAGCKTVCGHIVHPSQASEDRKEVNCKVCSNKKEKLP